MLGSIGELMSDREICGWRPQINKHVHYPAAAPDFLLVEVASQINFRKPGALIRAEQNAGFTKNLSLAAAAANCAELTIVAHNHLGPHFARRGTANVNNSRKCEWLLPFEGSHCFRPNM